jgi:hypothetical protein
MLMLYCPPTGEALDNFISKLHLSYKGSNADRLTAIKFVQGVNAAIPADNLHAKLGLLIFSLRKISDQHSYLNPNKSYQFYLFNLGSTLYSSLQSGLMISDKNKPSPANELVYLTAFYQFLQQSTLALPGYKNTAACITELKTDIKKLVDQSATDITHLLQKRPAASIFLKNFAQAPDKYHSKGQTGRDSNIEFLKILEQECLAHNLDNAQVSIQNSTHDIEKRPIGYAVRFAAMLYIMQQIEDEYVVRSPENSWLYQICQQATNLNRSSDVSRIETLAYYAELSSFIPKINPAQRSEYCWEDKGFLEGKKFFAKMQKNLSVVTSHIIDEKIANANGHPHLTRLSGFIENATLFGVSVFTGNIVNGVSNHQVGQSLIRGGASLLISGLVSPAGWVASPLIMVAGEKLLPLAINRVAGKVLHQIGSVVGHTAGQAVYVTFSIPVDALSALSQLLTKESKITGIKAYNDADWINSLLVLPDDIFPAKKKAIIKTIEDLAGNTEQSTNACSSSSSACLP